ncbi:MAG: ABC transporter ATP-binding protein [Bacilli bacterium]
MANIIYKLINVNKKYTNSNIVSNALTDISLTINEGELVVVLGPSGSGKSTMLNILSGIDNPTSGEVLFNNIDISKYSSIELTNYRKDNLGFIFQSYNLISNLTVKENIELGLQLSVNPINIDEVIKLVELDKHADKFPYQLSGGQMQRVAIARALVKNPKVLFCDEPTGALDETTGKKVLSLISNINKKYNTTIIIVTHNPSIKDMANTIIKMNSSKIVDIIYNKEVISADEIQWA